MKDSVESLYNNLSICTHGIRARTSFRYVTRNSVYYFSPINQQREEGGGSVGAKILLLLIVQIIIK